MSVSYNLNMKTPKEYSNNLKNHIITDGMLENCLFSLNKRAKNCRDKIREYSRNRYISLVKLDYGEVYEKKMNEYYSKKEELLKIVEPTCIHMEEQCAWHWFDPKEDDYYIDDRGNERRVWRDYSDGIPMLRDRYYLYYKFPNYSFHTPINCEGEYDIERRKADANTKRVRIDKEYGCFVDPQKQMKRKYIKENYRGMEIIELEDGIVTYGHEVRSLVSVQFVDKVIELYKSGDFRYIVENKVKEKNTIEECPF